MHGRMLLPGLFALFLPWFVIAIPETRVQRGVLVGALAGWTLGVALFWSPPYGWRIDRHGIADERLWYVHRAHVQRPVELADYRQLTYYRVGEKVGIMAQDEGFTAVYWAHIGIAPAVMPLTLTVIDPLGLNDYLTSRIELQKRGRPGHEKIAPPVWFQVRYPPGTGMIVRQQLDDALNTPPTQQELDAARNVLQIPLVKALQHAVTTPLTPELFWSNLRQAWTFSRLRIPADPREALKRFGAAPDDIGLKK